MKSSKNLNTSVLLAIVFLSVISESMYAIPRQFSNTALSKTESNSHESDQSIKNGEIILTLVATQIGQPISPYIFGEFIEHQGRCIYGGIWAEMIRDRKFYYPIDTLVYSDPDHKSPWRAIPIGTFVEMNITHVFVGEHSPRIDVSDELSRGISQDSIEIQQGRIYTGRVVLSGSGSVVVRVSLVWGPRPEDRQTLIITEITDEYTTIPLQYTAGASTDIACVEILVEGTGTVYIGAVSLMPVDNISGMRTDVIDLLRQLDATVYRWPGGWFGNGYDWHRAIGDRDKRAPMLNGIYGTEQLESNDFGPDEFMTFVETIGTEPYLGVSAMGPEDIQMAADEVEYFNGSSSTPMGQLRTTNGHPEPYNVRFWGIGCETWGFQALNDYSALHNQIAQAMLAVDPAIKIVAVGGLGSQGAVPGQGEWTEGMLTQSADYMDLISEHLYAIPGGSLIEYSRSLAVMVDTFVSAHREFAQELPSLQGKNIRLVLDEWNYFWGSKPYLYGDGGVRQYFKDAIGITTALHELFRNSDQIFMANTHPVNVLGHIKTTDTTAAFEVTALPLIVYRQHFGTLPLSITDDLDTLDVVAALTSDRKYLTVGIVNPTLQDITLTLDLDNAVQTGTGEWWRIESSDTLAYNEPGVPPNIVIESGSQPSVTPVLDAPPWSITLYKLPVQVGQSLPDSDIFTFVKTVQVAPDSIYYGGWFVRINHVPATGNLVVTFGTKLDKPTGGCTEKGFAYKEYNTDMQETGKSGIFTCAGYDVGSFMVDNTYYFANMDVNTGRGWRITKYDAVSWEAQADTFLQVNYPYEQDGDPMVVYANGQLDISGQYNASGSYPDTPLGAASFHYFLSPDFDILDYKLLSDTPHICGMSMIYLDSIYYLITANGFIGDVIVMKYDKDWNYLGLKNLIQDAHWSTGLAFDGNRFYLAYINTSQRTTNNFFLNAHLAAFDCDWNLLDDVDVTGFTPEDYKLAGRPWLTLHDKRLYVSYDVDSIDPITFRELVGARSFVSVYEISQVAASIDQPDRDPGEIQLEQNYPNPCDFTTEIPFSLPYRQRVTLKVYDIHGREIAVLVNEEKQQGKYTVKFNTGNLTNGMYFYQLVAGDSVQTRKCIVVR